MTSESDFSAPDTKNGDSARFTPFRCAALVGVGMMGGSLGLALRAQGLAQRVVGIDTRSETLEQAQTLGAIDAGVTELAEGVRHADLIVVAAPVGVIPGLLEKIAMQASSAALVTDLGSTKAQIVEAGTRLFGERFIGGHPMAGSEASGVQAARATLFAGAAWAIVRSESVSLENDTYAARLASLVTALGARPIPLSSLCHDRLVALVSHLPHVLSFAFAHAVAADPSAEKAKEMAGGSYRDMMRVSAADPLLWRDIFLDNRSAVLAALNAFELQLQTLKHAIETASPDDLLAELQKNAAAS